ncbi:MAG: UvrD-helicase domain-containing protein [Micromonosporaceae bacterium]
MPAPHPDSDAGAEAVLFDVPRVAVKPKPKPRRRGKAAPPPVKLPPPPVLPEPEPQYPVLAGMEEVGSGLLDRFDAMQRVAASAPGGQQLIVAGPGTGKTLVLTTRIAYLVKELGVPAAECLALVVDQPAAEQLTARLRTLLGEPAGEVTVTTYHQLGGLLAGYAGHPGADPQRLLDEDPVLTDRLHARWPWVFADNYEDVPEPAYRLLRWLCPPEGNLCAAADPDQALDTDARYALRFTEDYPDGRTVRLSRCYRSAATILSAAMQVIAPGSLVERRYLDPVRRDEIPALIGRYAAASPEDEVDFVVRTARSLVAEGYTGAGIAVLHPDPESLAPMLRGAVPEVTLLTLREAKGREFPVVFLTGCTAPALPESGGAGPGQDAGPEHAVARRLLFVGLTRAQQRLYVSYPTSPGTGASGLLESTDPRLFDSLNPATLPDPAADQQLRLL